MDDNSSTEYLQKVKQEYENNLAKGEDGSGIYQGIIDHINSLLVKRGYKETNNIQLLNIPNQEKPYEPNFTRPKEENKTESKEYGADNKFVSQDRYEELKKKMKAKLNQLNAGIDPEMLAIGMELAAYHLEAGARKFSAFSKLMAEEFGDKIKPYLKAFYNGAKEMPEMAEFEKDFDSYDVVKNHKFEEKTSVEKQEPIKMKEDKPKEPIKGEEKTNKSELGFTYEIIGSSSEWNKALDKGIFAVLVPKGTSFKDINDKKVIVSGKTSGSAFNNISRKAKEMGLDVNKYEIYQIVDGNSHDAFAYTYGIDGQSYWRESSIDRKTQAKPEDKATLQTESKEKQPYEMTREEFVSNLKQGNGMTGNNPLLTYKDEVIIPQGYTQSDLESLTDTKLLKMVEEAERLKSVSYQKYQDYFNSLDNATANTLIMLINSKYNPFDIHKERVQQAIKNGQEIPEEVLADYPDLKPKAEEPTLGGLPVTVKEIKHTKTGEPLWSVKLNDKVSALNNKGPIILFAFTTLLTFVPLEN